MQILCPINQPCIDDQSSLGNFSSEAPDVALFKGVRYKNQYWDGDYDQFYACLGLCTSPISQEEADLCANNNALICEAGKQFLSAATTCSSICADGVTRSYTVAQGYFVGFTQAEADAKATQYCAVYLAQICASFQDPAHPDVPPIPLMPPQPPNQRRSCNTAQVAEAFCVGGGRSITIPACSYWSNSVSGANNIAMQASIVEAGKVGCLTGLSRSFCINDVVSEDVVLSSSYAMDHPFVWTVIGTLPPGMTMNPDWLTAEFRGSPNTAGDYTFRLEVVDSNGTASWRDYFISVMEISEPPVLPAGEEDEPYSQFISVDDGILPLSYQLDLGSVLPPGLFLDETTGEIYGTPTTAGNYTFTIIVQDQAT